MFKRVFAWIGIVILVGLYLVGFVASLFNSPIASKIILTAIISTTIVPVVIYACLMFDKLSRKSTCDSELIDDEN